MSADVELWTIAQFAAHYEMTPAAAGKALRRAGVQARARQPGRGGADLYDTAEGHAAFAARPGRGARTDLRQDTTR